MKLHLEGKGDKLWCVHDENDEHIGAMLQSADAEFIYGGKGAPDDKVQFSAVDPQAALAHVQGLYDNGTFKSSDTDDEESDEKDEKSADGEAVASYLEHQVVNAFALAKHVDLSHRMVNICCAMIAKIMSRFDEDEQKVFLSAVTERIQKEVAALKRREELEKQLQSTLGSVIGSLLGRMAQDREDDDDDAPTSKKPEQPMAH